MNIKEFILNLSDSSIFYKFQHSFYFCSYIFLYPYNEFEGNPTQWYQQFEKFLESKKKDNRGKD